MSPRAKITLLTFFFAVCASGAVFTAWLQALADQNVRPAELYAIVDRQLGEVRIGHYDAAYEYASQAIQDRFSVDQFAAMIQSQYPALPYASRAEYGEVRNNGRHATIQVYLVGPRGEIIPCVYMLVREAGFWRINGARMLQPWPADMRMDGTIL